MRNASSGSVRVVYPRFSREELIILLRGHLPSLAAALPLTSVVLFGSWAEGRATAFSDIDLLVSYPGPPRDDAYRKVRSAVPIRGLEPHVYREEEAVLIRATLDRMTRNGVTLL